MRTWADDAGLEPRSLTINRDRGEGPRRCCSVALIAADHLWWFGGMPAGTLSALRAAVPRWQGIPDADLYLCDGCREFALRNQHVTRETIARAHGLKSPLVAAAWVHDEEFLRRGPASAPAEVQGQPWWAEYQRLHGSTPRGEFRSAIKHLLRDWNPHVP